MCAERTFLRIATEEAFAPPEMLRMYRDIIANDPGRDPGFMSLWGFFLSDKHDYPRNVVARLQDLDARRIQDMDAAGIDRQLIFLTGPGVQIFAAPEAVAVAISSNDMLADAIRRHP